jgi:hypothetical protein
MPTAKWRRRLDQTIVARIADHVRARLLAGLVLDPRAIGLDGSNAEPELWVDASRNLGIAWSADPSGILRSFLRAMLITNIEPAIEVAHP